MISGSARLSISIGYWKAYEVTFAYPKRCFFKNVGAPTTVAPLGKAVQVIEVGSHHFEKDRSQAELLITATGGLGSCPSQPKSATSGTWSTLETCSQLLGTTPIGFRAEQFRHDLRQSGRRLELLECALPGRLIWPESH